MMLAMSSNGSIRNCVWREKYRDLIGRDAIKSLLSVPKAQDAEKVIEEQKKFLREIKGNAVRIKLNDEITGNEEAIQGMITFDKKMNPYFDLSKKPEYGIYFGRIKYVDQYVNWYKNTHDRNSEMKPAIKELMIRVVKENYDDIQKSIIRLKKDFELWEMTTQYERALRARFPEKVSMISLSTASYTRYFYLQGIAAFLAKLPMEREDLDNLRIIGIRFMSEAYLISPRLSQRDILMAETFRYLKRKEELLCR